MDGIVDHIAPKVLGAARTLKVMDLVRPGNGKRCMGLWGGLLDHSIMESLLAPGLLLLQPSLPAGIPVPVGVDDEDRMELGDCVPFVAWEVIAVHADEHTPFARAITDGAVRRPSHPVPATAVHGRETLQHLDEGGVMLLYLGDRSVVLVVTLVPDQVQQFPGLLWDDAPLRAETAVEPAIRYQVVVRHAVLDGRNGY